MFERCVIISMGSYQYGLNVMLVILHVMIKEDQSCKSNAPLHMKQDTSSTEIYPLSPEQK